MTRYNIAEGHVREPSRGTILLIEEDGSLRLSLVEAIRSEGFMVIEAEDGESALSVALSRHPDLIMLDLLLPKMGGMQLLKTLRQYEWGKTARVIILSALSDPAIVSEASTLGVTDFLVKSDWSTEGIISKIKQKFLE